MRRTILITLLSLVAGLLLAGQGLSMEQSGEEMGSKGYSDMGETHGSEMAFHQLDQNQVRELQKILNDRGFNAGEVDGIFGPRTTHALRSFQESQGIAATGSPDKDTLQALAPDARTQELFGLSPEFDQEGMKEQMHDSMGQESMEHDSMQPDSMESDSMHKDTMEHDQMSPSSEY